MSIFIFLIVVWIFGTLFLYLYSFCLFLKSQYLRHFKADKEYLQFLDNFDSKINNLLNN